MILTYWFLNFFFSPTSCKRMPRAEYFISLLELYCLCFTWMNHFCISFFLFGWVYIHTVIYWMPLWMLMLMCVCFPLWFCGILGCNIEFFDFFFVARGKNRKYSNMLKLTFLYSQLYSMLYITNHKQQSLDLVASIYYYNNTSIVSLKPTGYLFCWSLSVIRISGWFPHVELIQSS